MLPNDRGHGLVLRGSRWPADPTAGTMEQLANASLSSHASQCHHGRLRYKDARRRLPRATCPRPSASKEPRAIGRPSHPASPRGPWRTIMGRRQPLSHPPESFWDKFGRLAVKLTAVGLGWDVVPSVGIHQPSLFVTLYENIST